MKLKKKLLIMIMKNILLHKNFKLNVSKENFTARLAQGNLPSKNDIAVLVKKTDFNKKLKKLNKNVTFT